MFFTSMRLLKLTGGCLEHVKRGVEWTPLPLKQANEGAGSCRSRRSPIVTQATSLKVKENWYLRGWAFFWGGVCFFVLLVEVCGPKWPGTHWIAKVALSSWRSACLNLPSVTDSSWALFLTRSSVHSFTTTLVYLRLLGAKQLVYSSRRSVVWSTSTLFHPQTTEHDSTIATPYILRNFPRGVGPRLHPAFLLPFP